MSHSRRPAAAKTPGLVPRIALAIAASALAACQAGAPGPDAPAVPPPPEAAWLLEGGPDERFARVARHLRGLDVAMMEIGYRYRELAWAGREVNFDYAAYQLGKIETALALAVERRPKRKASAEVMAAAAAPVRQAITAKDGPAFATAFEGFTRACNACHRAEQVPFMVVAPPDLHLSPLVSPAPGPTGR